ncbi:TrmH family RNA methyltransferase [Massiliimalia massiliensis]|uniref:TrmH family RNA methyltransferase n=1 Tax=Massiliimalia massiliensis TaxID=1852384 RepID=UPI0009851E1C|nr:RNA methyltransferase [Massiliimalia massiliensis]
MEQISSKENQNVKEYGKLVSSKSHRDKTGRFGIESVKLVLEAAASGIELEKVFVTDQCFKKHTAALQKLFESTCRIYEITEPVEQKMTHTQNAGGIFAICKKLDKRNLADTIVTGGKYLYLAGLQDSGNVGTIIRTAEAMGLSGVILSAGTCDLYSLKVLRASMGSAFRLPVILGGDPLADIEKFRGGFVTYAAVVDENADSVLETRFADCSVVVVGNEGNGLSREAAQACDHQITIRMKGNAESLNAGMAAGILMWELVRDH